MLQQRLENAIKHLTHITAVSTELLSLTRDPACSVDAVVSIMEKDPALSAKILRVACSPYFGYSQGIKTIPQAVLRIGIRTLTSIVMAETMHATFERLPSYGQSLWVHSLGCAASARELASCRAFMVDRDEAFLAGLLHDIGLLVMIGAASAELAEIYRERDAMQTEYLRRETEVFGIDHVSLGIEVSRRWDYPTGIAMAIENHIALARQDCPLCSVVHLADKICKFCGIGLVHFPSLVLEDTESARALGLSREEIHLIVQRITEDHASRQEFFSLL